MIRRFNFDKVLNLRDLGGYMINENMMTKWNRYYRSDDLSFITDAEKSVLMEKGLTTVIDLRSDYELEQNPSPFAEDITVVYVNCPTLIVNRNAIDYNNLPDTMGELYEIMLADKSFVKTVFEQLASNDGIVLFHCSAGKDRTGIISALLLGLVGVSERDIITNYQQSAVNLKGKFYNMPQYETATMVQNMNKNLSGSDAAAMEHVLQYLQTNYDTIEAYLLSCELPEATLATIKTSFVTKLA